MIEQTAEKEMDRKRTNERAY